MIKLLLNILLFVAPFLFIFIYGLFFLPIQLESNNMLFASIEKRNRLKTIQEPKIVFIGGSSMAFGLDSKTIEEKLNYPVINMGLHAGVGLRYMILEAAPYLKKGDIVVIGAEYEQFTTNGFYGESVLPPLLFDIHKQDYKTLNFRATIELFSHIIDYDLKKIKLFVVSKKEEQKIDTVNKTNNHQKYTIKNIYSKNSFNEYGDMVAHWKLESPKFDLPKNHKISLANDEVITFLSTFKKEMNTKGVKVLFVPPPYNKRLFEKNYETITNMDKQLNFIAAPKRYTFLDSLFFDTNYHLNKKGVDKRTQYLIEDILKYLKEYPAN